MSLEPRSPGCQNITLVTAWSLFILFCSGPIPGERPGGCWADGPARSPQRASGGPPIAGQEPGQLLWPSALSSETRTWPSPGCSKYVERPLLVAAPGTPRHVLRPVERDSGDPTLKLALRSRLGLRGGRSTSRRATRAGTWRVIASRAEPEKPIGSPFVQSADAREMRNTGTSWRGPGPLRSGAGAEGCRRPYKSCGQTSRVSPEPSIEAWLSPVAPQPGSGASSAPPRTWV